MNKRMLMLLWLAMAGCGSTDGGDPSALQGDASSVRDGAGRETGEMVDMDGGDMQGMAMAMAGGPIRLSQQQAALAGVTFAVAQQAALERTVRAVAMAVPDETTLGIVNARVRGWVEELYANETGRRVGKGEALLELYAPDLVTAQEELLLARRLPATASGDSLVAASRRRLELWDISADQIAELERSGVVRRTLTIRSAYPGHVLEKNVIEGQAVMPGDPLFRIADLSTVWIEPAIFERDISLIRRGQRAEVSFNALPGDLFAAGVTFLHPTLDERTRSLKIRLEVPNHEFLIKPGMYGTVRIRTTGPQGVIVPLTAVLPTGEHDLAFVVHGDGVTPTEVTVAARGDSSIVISEGLAAGDTVVASATFLFDSESSLAAALKGIMLNMGMGLDMGGMQMDKKDGKPEGAEGGVR